MVNASDQAHAFVQLFDGSILITFNDLEWDSELRYVIFIGISNPRKMLNLLLQLFQVKSGGGGGIFSKIEIIMIHLNYLGYKPEKNQLI